MHIYDNATVIYNKFDYILVTYYQIDMIYIKRCLCDKIYRGKEWGSSSRNCYGELQPIEGSSYPTGLPEAQVVLNKVLSNVKKPVILLDITTLSQLRKDAHPSSYSDSGVDCSHWCVPGLPDTWNQLMYASFLT